MRYVLPNFDDCTVPQWLVGIHLVDSVGRSTVLDIYDESNMATVSLFTMFPFKTL